MVSALLGAACTFKTETAAGWSTCTFFFEFLFSCELHIWILLFESSCDIFPLQQQMIISNQVIIFVFILLFHKNNAAAVVAHA
jgi:hypothetical protein